MKKWIAKLGILAILLSGLIYVTSSGRKVYAMEINGCLRSMTDLENEIKNQRNRMKSSSSNFQLQKLKAAMRELERKCS